MSSLVRRIQKNIAKAQGFYRGPSRNEEIREATGKMANEFIYNSDDEPVGYHWPQVAAPTRPKEG